MKWPSIAYLFDPEQAATALESLPHLRPRLSPPQQEGQPSQAFPTARRSWRQIFRVLGNRHYRHLDDLLRALDRCIGSGFNQPNLIRSRSWKTFGENLAELHIADHLADQGFELSSFDATRDNTPVPDLLATRGGLRLAIEVYTPRRWEALATYKDALRDSLKNIDQPFNFQCTVEHKTIGPTRNARLTGEHPGALSRSLEHARLDDDIARLIDDLRPQLRTGQASTSLRLDSQSIWTSIACKTRRATDSLPIRMITSTGPPLSGYAPEHDFCGIADRALQKLREGQATRIGDAIPCLIVDLSLSNLEQELAHTAYRELFYQALDARFAELNGHAVVAFLHGRAWRKPPSVFWMKLASGIPPEVAKTMGTPQSRP